MKAAPKPCRVCTELERAIYSLRQPISPFTKMDMVEEEIRTLATEREKAVEEVEELLIRHKTKCRRGPGLTAY